MNTKKELLEELKQLYNDGLISQAVWEQRQLEILQQGDRGNDFVTRALGT